MNAEHPITWLVFFTLSAGIVVAGGAFLYFLRSRHNRFLADVALMGRGQSGTGAAPDGALPEIIGLLAIALVAMALLGLGYASR